MNCNLLPARATLAGIGLAALAWAGPAAAQALQTAPVVVSNAAAMARYDGVVEALRQTVLAAQVAGSVTQIAVKPGDAVRAGQVLIRIDARAAEQNAAASDAQVESARASLELATQEYQRQQQLLNKNYISYAAFERAQAQFKATQAQVAAQLAVAGGARTQSGFFTVQAPYAGIVAEVPVAIGDMALPGKPLLTLYDPSALRVTAMVAQSAVGEGAGVGGARVELPGQATGRQWLTPVHVQVLPTLDPGTHTVEVRLELARGTRGLAPGMFARAWLPARTASAAPESARLFVPAGAIVRRAELTALYVVDADGRAVLRQVRLGERQRGADQDAIEVLAGVSAGERVALDPQAAARAR